VLGDSIAIGEYQRLIFPGRAMHRRRVALASTPARRRIHALLRSASSENTAVCGGYARETCETGSVAVRRDYEHRLQRKSATPEAVVGLKIVLVSSASRVCLASDQRPADG
jgi:hypothetical protein